MRRLGAMGFALFGLLLTHCGSRQFTQGKYDDLAEERHLDDKFNESDMKHIADTMVQSLAGSAIVTQKKRRPVILVTMMKNMSHEHVDMESLTDKVRVSLQKSGKFAFSSKAAREEIGQEVEYQNQSGYVDPATARKKGKQIGADYFLTGEMRSNVQEVGEKKYVYYKCTFNLVNIESGLIDWSDEKELRKAYQKRTVGF